MGNVKVTLTGDEMRLLKSLQRVIDKEKKLGKAGEDAGKKSARGSRKAQDAARNMGREFSRQFKSVITGALGATAGIAGIVSVMRALNEERKRAAQGYKQAGTSLGQLAQLAKTPEEFQALLTGAKRISKIGGQTPERAAGLMFAIKSGGLEKEVELLAKLRFFMRDVPEVVNHLVGLQAALGEAETGGVRQLLSKGLVASGVTKTKVSEIMATAIFPAKQAGAIGMTDEELFAITAYLTKATKSPEIAGTQVQAFGSFIEKKGMGGKGMLAAVEEISKKELSGKELASYIPNIRARAGYRGILDLMPKIKALEKQLAQADVEAKEGGGRVGTMISVAEADPRFKAFMKQQTAAARKTWAEIDVLAKKQLGVEAIISDISEKSIRTEEGPVSRLVRTTILKAAGGLGGGPELVEGVNKALFKPLSDVEGYEEMRDIIHAKESALYGGTTEYETTMRKGLGEGSVTLENFSRIMEMSMEETKKLRETLEEVIRQQGGKTIGYTIKPYHPGDH